VGIDVRGKRDWTFAFSLHDKPSRPPDTVTRKMTMFALDVWAGFWCVHLYHFGAEFNCERTGRYPIMRRTTEPSPTLVLPLAKLESVRAWLTRVERKLEVTFHRDRPRVHSNVKGAAKLITAWLADA
jgi:hypothetical protein